MLPSSLAERQKFLRRLLHVFITLRLLSVVLLGMALLLDEPENWERLWLALINVITALPALLMIILDRLRLASWLLVADSWLMITLAAITREGVQDPILSGYILIIFAAAMLINRWAAVGVAGLSVAVTFAMLHVPTENFLPMLHTDTSPIVFWRVRAIFYLITAGLLFYATEKLQAVLAELWQSRHELEQRNRDLQKKIELALQMEQAMRASEEQLRLIIANAPIAIFALDETGLIAPPKTDPRAPFALTSNQLIIQSIIDRYHELPIILDNARRALEGEIVKYELPIGNRIFEIRNVPLPGKHAGMKVIGVATDITEFRNAEDALKGALMQRDTLLEINRAITGELDLDTLLRLIVQSVTRALPDAQCCSVYLYDESEAVLVERASEGWASNLDMPPLAIRPVSELLMRVFTTGLAYVSSPEESAKFRVITKVPQVDDIKSMVVVPLVFSNRTIGVLSAYNNSRLGVFDEESKEFLRLLAAPAAAAIEAAHLHREAMLARDQAQALAEQVLQARENENRRIALELHDVFGQELTAMVLELSMLRKKLPVDALDLRGQLDETIRFAQNVLDQMRSLSIELRPSILDDAGLQEALEEYAARYMERTQIEAKLSLKGLHERLPSQLETTIFRLVQESLNNTLRYAQANCVWITIEVDEKSISGEIKDNGIGFEVPPKLYFPDKLLHGSGLSGMRERVKLLGGEWSIRSEKGEGTCISFRLPIKKGKEPLR